MKKVLNIFAKPAEARIGNRTNYGFREPSLYSVHPAPNRPSKPFSHNAAHEPSRAPMGTTRKEARNEALDIPSDYAGIVAFFQDIVAKRKSPFNSLVHASERLKDYIPDEISRLKAAYALCGEQWQGDVLALAINHHIADIENACNKAKESKHLYTTERTQQIRAESDLLKQQNAKLNAEIELLKKSLAQLQDKYDTTQTKINSLEEQARSIEKDAYSVSFLEQAAENLKNDLLAKKVLLGLTI